MRPHPLDPPRPLLPLVTSRVPSVISAALVAAVFGPIIPGVAGIGTAVIASCVYSAIITTASIRVLCGPVLMGVPFPPVVPTNSGIIPSPRIVAVFCDAVFSPRIPSPGGITATIRRQANQDDTDCQQGFHALKPTSRRPIV
jgi:hypothetical protein